MARSGEPRREDLDDAVPTPAARREIRVGVFAILGVAAALVTLFALTDPGMFRGRYAVETHVADAGGLRKGDPVQMRGVNIGHVSEFDVERDRVAIRLELEREYPVPADSRVVLRSSGLLGGMTADVVPGRSQEELDGGDVLPGRTVRGMLDPGSGVGGRADTIMSRVEMLLSPETVENTAESVAELRLLLAEMSALVEEERREIRGLTSSLRRSAAGLESATTGPELERTVARADSLTARLNESASTLGRASGSLEVFAARLENGEGTLGRLSTDDSLYVNLNRAAENVDAAAQNMSALLLDIQENPRRYINLEVF